MSISIWSASAAPTVDLPFIYIWQFYYSSLRSYCETLNVLCLWQLFSSPNFVLLIWVFYYCIWVNLLNAPKWNGGKLMLPLFIQHKSAIITFGTLVRILSMSLLELCLILGWCKSVTPLSLARMKIPTCLSIFFYLIPILDKIPNSC